MSEKERKQRQKAEMREAILSAALVLFSEEGFEKVTMRKIADRIEYSVGTLYLYFKDKDEILFELHNRGFSEFYKRQLSVQNIEDPVERVTEHGVVYIQFAIDNPEYYDLMFISRAPAKIIKKNKDWECGIRTYDLLKKNIMQAKDVGKFKNVDLEVTAFSLWAFVHGIASLYIRERILIFPAESLKQIIAGSLGFLQRAY
jgi:AcrR family transcriptional regulator